MGARQQARNVAHWHMEQVKKGVPDAVEWFRQAIEQNPGEALNYLVGADLAIVRPQGIEWRKPQHRAVEMYRKAQADRNRSG
jgi:TPR repeat protein